MRGIACYIVLLSKCNCWQVYQFPKGFYGSGVGGAYIDEKHKPSLCALNVFVVWQITSQ